MTPSTHHALRWINLLVVLTLILPPSPVFATPSAQPPIDLRPQGESSVRSASNSAALAEEELRAIAPRSRPLTTIAPRPYLPTILHGASPAPDEKAGRPDRAAPLATELLSSFAAQSGGGRLWAGTSNAGVWLYENGVWSQRSNGLGDVSVRSVQVNPYDHNVLLAVASAGVYRTTDRGQNWSAVTMPFTQTGWNTVFWDRASLGKVVISGPDLGEVFNTDPRAAVSNDGGQTWTGIDLPVGDVAEARPGDVWGFAGQWVMLGNSFQNIVLGWPCHRRAFWRSSDHGQTWQLVCSWPRENFDVDRHVTGLWLDPFHLFGTFDHPFANPIIESTNGGLSWSTGTFTTTDQRQIVADPLQHGRLWLAANSRLYRSASGASGFQAVFTSTAQVRAVAVDGYAGTIYGGGNSRLMAFSTDGGSNWTEARLPLGGPVTSGTTLQALAAEQPPSLLADQTYAKNVCPVGGNAEKQNYLVDPINSYSGNYNYETTDLSIPTLGKPLRFERAYNSLPVTGSVVYSQPLGYGWTHSYDIRLTFPTDPGGESGTIIFKTCGGSRMRFQDDGAGGYAPYPGVWATLTHTLASPYVYTVTAVNQETFVFTDTGRLTTHIDPKGSQTTFTYTNGITLSRVTAPGGGRWLDFSYNAQGRLASVTDHIGRSVGFGYDGNGDLTVVTDTRGLTWTYTYTGSHLLHAVVDPDGRVVERTFYDAQGRAVRQEDGLGNPIAEINYLTSGRVVTESGKVMTDTYNAQNLLTGQTDSSGNSPAYTFDGFFNRDSATDANGNTTQFARTQFGLTTAITDAAGFTTTLSYDALSNPTRIVDARSFVTRFAYSGTLLISQTDALANTWIYTYGLNNLLVAQQDPLGRITRFEYDAFGQRTVMTDALGSATRYAYDSVGRLITTTDALGRITVNAYDNADHLISVTDNYTSTSSQQNYLEAFNRITRYAYDGFGRRVLVTDTLGRVTRSGYDAAGRLVSTTVNHSPTVGQNYLNQYNLVTQYGYDATGKQTHVTDTLGFVTRTEYDSLNRPVTVTTNYKDGVFDPARPDEDIRRVIGYDAAGNVITQTDALGRVTRTFYDSLNRVISTTENYTAGQPPNYQGEFNLVTQYAYDQVGNTVLVTDTLGRVTRNYYDALGRVVSATVNYSPTLGVNYANQYNLTTRYEYDKVGNRVVMTDPLTGTTRYAYDALNRVITATDALSGTTVTVYDAAGNRIKTIDALNHTTVYTYDAADRLVMMQDAGGSVTAYAYDALGNTRVVTDANGNPTLTAYDALNRVVTTTNALSGTTVFGYDALGRRTVMTDANSHATRTTYDGVGRPITTTDALGNITIVGYDALGNRVKTTDGLGHTTVYTYDTLNRQIGMQDAGGNVTAYAYDALGNRVVMTDANGVVTQYGYDALNRLAIITESVTSTVGLDPNVYNLVTRYGYDALGNRTVITNARGFTTTYTYDALYRMTALRDPLGNTTRYAYDKVGNRTVMTDANGAVISYTYDLVNRLARIGYPDSSVTYAYDKVGNRTLMTDTLGTTRYTYDALYRLTNVVDPYSQPVTYTFDAVGSRTKVIYPDGKVVTYTYDAASRLTTVTDWSSQATTYAYDAAHRLITTTLPNGVRSVYTYDDANRLTRLTHTRNGGSEIVGDYEFTLDKVGNRLAVTETLLSPGGAGGVGPQLGALPTLADEVVASVTGHRPPGLSALAISTDTLSLVSATGLARSAPFDAPGWPASRGVKTAQAGVAGQTGAAPASPGGAVYLPAPLLKPYEQAPSGEALLLYTSRPSVTADGADAVLVGVVALDANRRALPDGTPVAWTATLGSLTPISNGLANSVALARFVGGQAPGEATITVQIGAATSAARVSIVAAPADPDSEPEVYDEAAELKELMAYLRTAIRRDASGRLGIDAATHGVLFEAGRVVFTPAGRQGRDSTASFTYQLTTVRAGSSVLPLGASLDAPVVSVTGNTLAYARGSGVVEWYTGRRDGLEQGFTFAALLPLDGDLVIVGAFATRLRPELVSQQEGILFREPASGEGVFRYGGALATDSAGRRTAGQLELRGNQIAIRVAQAWLAQAVYPVTVDPLLQNDLIFADGFESGDFSAWSAAVTDGGDLSVTAAAALVGTYGMQALIDDTTRIYARDDTPANEARYRARFYFDPNAVTMSDNQDHDLLDGRTSADSVFRVQLKFLNGGYQVRARIRTDAGSDLSTGDYPISDAPHFVEVDWAAATGAGANDGYLSLWIDGVLQETKAGIDNDTLRVEQARLGATGSMEAGIAGTEYFDAFESRRQTYIGPVGGGGLLTTTIAYTYDPLYRLTGATYSGAYTYTFGYAYDAVGNRTVMTKTITSTLVTTYTYDAADRLTSVNGQAYTWDNNGNLLNDGNRTYTYDHANRLISISGPGLTWSAVYNGDGVRLKQIANGAVTTYTLDYADDNRILVETTAQGTTLYLYGYECLGEYANDTWLYYLNTAAGYVRQTTDASAQLVSAWIYSPDGLVLAGPQGMVSHLVCGGVYDWATGLIYIGGRYFNPALGVYLGLSPLLAIELWRERKKNRRLFKWYVLLILLICAGGLLTACTQLPTTTPCPGETPPTFMPMSGSEPPYEPDKWNDGSGMQYTNNCYSYAADDFRGHNDINLPQPGVRAGFDAPLALPVQCEDLMSRAALDGFVEHDCDTACESGYYKTAFFITDQPPTIGNYHVYRQDQGGYWSHKRGKLPVSDLDAGGQKILDPRRANNNYPEGTYTFCGCMCVRPGTETESRTNFTEGP